MAENSINTPTNVNTSIRPRKTDAARMYRGEQELLNFLRSYVCLNAKEGRPWRKRTPSDSATWEDFVLQHGRFWPFKRIPGIHIRRKPDTPDHFRPLPLSWCHGNALHLTLADARLTYVEGFAFSPRPRGRWGILCPHAWVVDPDGVVIDATWRNVLAVKLEGGIYFGVLFSGEWLMGQLSPTRFGFLAMWRSIFEEFDDLPDLKGQSRKWRGQPGSVKSASSNREHLFSLRSSDDPTFACLSKLATNNCEKKTSDIFELSWDCYETRKDNFCFYPMKNTARLGTWLSDRRSALSQIGIDLVRIRPGRWRIRTCAPLAPTSNQDWRDLVPKAQWRSTYS